MNKLVILLTPEEEEAITRMAIKDMRYVEDQARWVLLQAVRRRGLLKTESRAQKQAERTTSKEAQDIGSIHTK